MANSAEALVILREKLLPRGSASVHLLSKKFRQLADEDRVELQFDEFVKGLTEFGVKLDEDVAKTLFKEFDKDGSGTIDVDEFVSKVKPPLPAARRQILEEAFKQVDKAGDGAITVEDLKGVYDPKYHPKVRAKIMTKNEALLVFLSMFDTRDNKDGKVTLEEFVNFYESVSHTIAKDDDFKQMLQSAWKLNN